MSGAVKIDLVLERLEKWRLKYPDRYMCTWLDIKGNIESRYTYQAFATATDNLAIALRRPKDLGGFGIPKGDRVLLVYPPSLDFLVAFIACLKANLVAVPVFPPDPSSLTKTLYLFTAVARDSGAQVALSNSTYGWAKRAAGIKAFFTRNRQTWPDLVWVETDKQMPAQAGETVPPPPSPDDIAFLQYTSGSTSDPKGVMILHRNLAHNLFIIVRSIGAKESTTEVSWLPQYHDMGLIGSYLGLLYCGGKGVYTSPLSFIKNPVLWLQMMSQHKATHTQVPHFAIKLSLRKFKAKPPANAASMRFDTLEHVFNAAEPIEGKDIDAFLSQFGPMGFPARAMAPGYGLAEHTVYVCGNGSQRLWLDKVALQDRRIQAVRAGSPNSMELVGCGSPLQNPSVDLRIVDRETCNEVPEEQIGEIWVDSPSKAAGYWGQHELSKQDFNATINTYCREEKSDQQHTYLRTGDLGFMHHGELFVCGRIKDLIIVRGRNHYPQDLERAIEAADDNLRPGCSAAFSVVLTPGGSEQLAFVAELREPGLVSTAGAQQGLAQKLNKTLNSMYGINAVAMVFINPRTVPKTSSGKIMRSRSKEGFLGGSKRVQLSTVFRWDAHQPAAPPAPAPAAAAASASASASASATGSDSAAIEVQPEKLSPEHLTMLQSAEAQALMAKMKEEISLLYEEDKQAADIDETLALSYLGLESVMIQQLANLLETDFKVVIEVQVLFHESTTLQKIVLTAMGEDVLPKVEDLEAAMEEGTDVTDESAPAAPAPAAAASTAELESGVAMESGVVTVAPPEKKCSDNCVLQ